MADMSFTDVRSAVRDALAAVDKDGGDDLCVTDLGSNWVVYSDPDTVGGGTFRRSYSLDDDGYKVSFTSDPERVVRCTTYEPVAQPKDLKSAAKATRAAFAAARKGDK